MYYSMLKKLKCYHNYPSTIFVKILGRPSLTLTFTFTKPTFTSESEHFTFYFAHKYITNLFGAIYLPPSQANIPHSIINNYLYVSLIGKEFHIMSNTA
jgi:hypothetical protein